jgi:hypothetical protein
MSSNGKAPPSANDVHTAVFKGNVKPHTPRQRNRYSPPGPGTYNTDSSVGKQASSTKSTASKFSFGTQNRTAYEKTMLSKEHQALMPRNDTQKADFTPTNRTNHLGRNIIYSTAPNTGFGTAARGDFARTTPMMS